MRRRLLSLGLFGVLGLVCVLGAASDVSAAPPPAWGSAIEVPGTGSLNLYGQANTKAISCSGAGSCAAGGTYMDASDRPQAFVVDQTNGTWGTAIEVPGTAALNAGANYTAGAVVNSISCTSAGNCTAGGNYIDAQFFAQAFVVDETNGTWGNAIEIPGTAALNISGDAKVNSVSCATAGNCAAGGFYHDSAHHLQAFVAEETNGIWGAAIEVPGTATLNATSTSGLGAETISVSCHTAGNCTAAGYYTDVANRKQAFVVDETNGIWGNAIEVPGTASLNGGGNANIRSVSCATTGNCSAGGFYTDASNHARVFVVDETNGTWSNAIEAPGTAALNSGGNARVVSVSCTTAGNCAAGGWYWDASGNQGGFVIDETNGTWGNAIDLPASLNVGGDAEVRSVSCTSPGNCAAVGWYVDEYWNFEGFVANEQNGTWDNAVEVPGFETLNTSGDGRMNVVSCGAADNCAAGGQYADDNYDYQALVVNSAPTGTTALAPAAATGTYGGTTTLSATLTSAGNFVPNEIVTFKVNGTSVGSATTDGSGVATLPNVSLAGIQAGSYPAGVSASFDGDGTPGDASSGSSSLTVSKAALSITAGDRQKFYAQALTLGTTAFTPVGLVGSDSVSGVTLTSAGADGGAATGNYSIVPSQAVSGPSTDLADNYTITYHNGNLHVNPVGIAALSNISVKTSGGLIDSFDSSLGPYGTSNHASAALLMSNGALGLSGVNLFGNATSTQGAVTIASTAHVVGNILAGTTASIAGSVTGTVTRNSPSTALSGPTVAACSPFSPKAGMSGGTFSYSAATGNLTVSMGTVTLANGTYCFHTIALGTGTKLVVNGPVTIHLTGKITGATGRILNNTDNPANLHIDSSFVGIGALTIAGSAHAYMTVTAPGVAVTIPSGSFFGTVLAKTVNLAGGAAFHADTH